jgi:hypothetical protein
VGRATALIWSFGRGPRPSMQLAQRLRKLVDAIVNDVSVRARDELDRLETRRAEHDPLLAKPAECSG